MLKRLVIEDMDEAATVLRASFDHALPWLAGLHTPDEDRWFFRERLFNTCQLWGRFAEGQMVGIIAFRRDWIDQLYVLPLAQRQGFGTELLRVAQHSFGRLNLWTLRRNDRARRFYEWHGFSLLMETDGADNEEQEPDALYQWIKPGGWE
jgi:putative acetyltransferase